MTIRIRLILPLALMAALAACNTDPFGVKPEVPGVRIPDKSAEPAGPASETETKDKETQP